MRAILLAVTAIMPICTAAAETLKVVNWNEKAGSVENILKRQAGIAQVPEGEIPDILILQEINSYAAANLVADTYVCKMQILVFVNQISDSSSLLGSQPPIYSNSKSLLHSTRNLFLMLLRTYARSPA